MVAWPLFQEEGGGSIPTSPLQLRLYEIDPRRAMDLNYKWHSVLPDTNLATIVGRTRRMAYYAAEFDGRFFAVAIWTDPIAQNRLKNGDSIIELRRLAICDSAPKNTASRLLAVMARLIAKKYPDVRRLISYQAVAHHSGTIYKAAGWTEGPTSAFQGWQFKNGQRNSFLQAQTQSAKIRWEKEL